MRTRIFVYDGDIEVARWTDNFSGKEEKEVVSLTVSDLSEYASIDMTLDEAREVLAALAAAIAGLEEV